MLASPTAAQSVALAASVALPLAVYSLTLAPTITWRHGGSDSGELAAAVAVGAVPHPPGYPLYLALGQLFVLLAPFAEPAQALNLFSALCVAASAVFLFAAAFVLARALNGTPGACSVLALGAALSYAFAPLPWSQAILTEVYGLALLIETALLFLLVRSALGPVAPSRAASAASVWQDPTGEAAVGPRAIPWRALAAAFLGGLALAAHTSLIWLLVGAAWLLVLRWRLIPGGRARWLMPLLFAIGVLPYALLPLTEQAQPLPSWGRTDTLDGFLHHVTAADYHDLVFALSPTEMLERLPVIVRTVAAQFTWAGLALALLGAWWLRERRPVVLWLTLPTVIGGIVFVLGYGANHPEIYLVFTLPVASLWLVAGLCWVWERGGTVRALAPAAALLLPAALVLTSYGALDLHRDVSAREYGIRTLAQAPDRAVIVTRRDQQAFSLWYAQRALGWRPDVLVVDRRALALAWYADSLGVLRPDLRTASDLATLKQRNPHLTYLEAPGVDESLER